MRSRTARLTVGAVALIAAGTAAYFLTRSEIQISTLRASIRTFDRHARETAEALAELRSAQQAYVAAGQGAPFWIPKVAAAAEHVENGIASLRRSARSARGRTLLMETEATIAEFDIVDRRAREYLTSGDDLMASDVIFTEGRNVAAAASHQVETARLAEEQELDAREGVLRRRQALALGAAAGVGTIVVLLLVRKEPAEAGASWNDQLRQEPAAPAEESEPSPTSPLPATTVQPSSSAPAFLKMAADLSTEFGRVRDIGDLNRLLARAAEGMDAKGLVVWLGSCEGADLQPVVAHGYSSQAVARMPAVPRSADNAAAAAYRTGLQQIVRSRAGESSGAIVAPILTADGCVGALCAEIRGGSESSEPVQLLASIIAAHLAGIFADATADVESHARRSAQA
jgi:hypothetical protein